MATVVEGDLYYKITGQLLEILRQIRQKGGYPHDPVILSECLQTLIERGSGFTIKVDYSLDFDTLKAAGHYDWANSDITVEHFPTQGSGVVEYECTLVHFDREISDEAAEAEIKKMGLIPASAFELLVFGAKYPEEQRKYPIVAIGQSWLGPDGCSYMYRKL